MHVGKDNERRCPHFYWPLTFLPIPSPGILMPVSSHLRFPGKLFSCPSVYPCCSHTLSFTSIGPQFPLPQNNSYGNDTTTGNKSLVVCSMGKNASILFTQEGPNKIF